MRVVAAAVVLLAAVPVMSGCGPERAGEQAAAGGSVPSASLSPSPSSSPSAPLPRDERSHRDGFPTCVHSRVVPVTELPTATPSPDALFLWPLYVECEPAVPELEVPPDHKVEQGPQPPS